MNSRETPDNDTPHRQSKRAHESERGHAEFHSSELSGAMQRVLDYLHGEMTAPERRKFEDQVERSVELATEVREMQALLAAVQTVCDSGPALARSSQLRNAVKDRLARTHLESLLNTPDSDSMPASISPVPPPVAPVVASSEAPSCAGLDTETRKLPVDMFPVRAIFRGRIPIVAAAIAAVALGMVWLVSPREVSPLVATAPVDPKELSGEAHLVNTPKNQSVSGPTPASPDSGVESADGRRSPERAEHVEIGSLDNNDAKKVADEAKDWKAHADRLSEPGGIRAAMAGKHLEGVEYKESLPQGRPDNNTAADGTSVARLEEGVVHRNGVAGFSRMLGGGGGMSGMPGGASGSGGLGMRGGSGKSGIPGGGEPGMPGEDRFPGAGTNSRTPQKRQGGSHQALHKGLIENGRTSDEYRYRTRTDLGYSEEKARERLSLQESYQLVEERDFLTVDRQTARSTFSIDVDSASYANVRRYLNGGQLPPVDSVRIEELVNYFTYDYPPPEDDRPLAVSFEIATCPWQPEHELLRVGLKGRELPQRERPAANLVFLIDVSGSMSSDDKLPLLKRSLNRMVDELGESDTVSIVTYSDTARIVLDCTNGLEKATILAAINQLHAAGSTNGAAGIQLAYAKAVNHLLPGGTNRVLLATDGDLNVGVTNTEQLVALIREHAQQNVFLTVLGFGTGNLKDDRLEQLADKGNGVYAYIDGFKEGQRVLVEQLSGTLTTIAKDVKLQIEFNPAEVSAYRLIGYDNRVLGDHEFHDDHRDAGDLGAGHMVTALYEIVPARRQGELAAFNKLKYQPDAAPAQKPAEAVQQGELLTLQFRYKLPHESESRLYELPFMHEKHRFGEASADFQFASAVAAFGMILRQSPYRGQATLNGVEEVAAAALGLDPRGIRAEFVDLVRRAKGKGLN